MPTENPSMIDLLLIVTPTSINFYNKKGQLLKELIFDKPFIDNFQFGDKQHFKTRVTEFIQTLAVGPRQILLLLDHHMVLKTIESKKEASEDSSDKKVEEEHPIPSNHQIKNKLTTSDQVHLFTTSDEIINLLYTTFESVHWHIGGILPVTMYTKSQKLDHFTADLIQTILSDTELIKLGNFLSHTKPMDVPSSPKPFLTTQYPPILLIFILTILTTLILGGVYYLTHFSSESDSNSQTPQLSQTPPSNTNPTPTPQPQIQKSDLTVQVLNGSGISGQAGKIKDQFSPLGFKTIDTGNASDNTASTMVVFSAKVTNQIQNEVITQLKKTFSKIESKTDSQTSKYDIQITTGTDE